MRRALALVCLASVSVIALAGPAQAGESADECVRLRESVDTTGLGLDVDNHCDRRLSCSLSWTVQCESATGKVTRRTKDGARFVVASAGSGHAFASAKSCGDNWRIEDVSWDCAPLK